MVKDGVPAMEVVKSADDRVALSARYVLSGVAVQSIVPRLLSSIGPLRDGSGE